MLEQIANKDNRILDYQFFVPGGGPHPLSRRDLVLVVGQEYRPPFWGHVFMFGMKDHLISPFTTGYEGTAIESLYPTNTDMFRKAKAQGASVGYVHAFPGERDPLEAELGGAKGSMVDAALGTTDAIEWSAANRSRVLSDVRDLEQRLEGDGGRRRGLDQQPPQEQARRVAPDLCLHRRARSGHARLAGRHARRPRVCHERTTRGAHGERRPARRDRFPARRRRTRSTSRRACAQSCRSSTSTLYFNGQPVEKSAAQRRPQVRRLPSLAPARSQRVVSRTGRRRTRRSIPARHRLSTGVHQPGVGHRREPAGSRSRVGRIRAAVDRQASDAGGEVAGLALAKREGPRLRAV